MTNVEPSLRERAGRLHRRLLLLQHLFRSHEDDASPFGPDDAPNPALGAAVREVLDELVENAQTLTTVPFPLSEWRPGDTCDDERWRALTQVERRELQSLIAGYEALIVWAEEMTHNQLELAALVELSGAVRGKGEAYACKPGGDAVDYLKAERARMERFRQELRFLDVARTG